MKHLLIACVLSFTAPSAFAQETPAAPPVPEAPVAAPPAADREATRGELEDRIETSVLRLVEKVINAVGDEIPAEDKAEILADVRTELEGEREKLVIVDGSDSESREALKKKVEAGVLRLVDKAVTASGDVSEEEKAALLSELKEELADERESDSGFNITIGDDGGSGSMGLHEMIIAIIAISLIFGTPIFVVIAVLYAGYRKRRLVQETISQYLASGKDVPPEILESIHGGSEKPKNYLQKGFVMVGVGVGIFLCFAIMGEIGVASLGIIPLFIGLAQILIWKLEKPDNGARG